ERAAAMLERLYPQGHADLAACLAHLGFVLVAQGEGERARAHLERATAMYEQLASSFFVSASEAEALNFPLLPMARRLLTYRQSLGEPDDRLSASAWNCKAAVARAVQRRQRALIQAADPQTRELARQLSVVRRDLAALIPHPAGQVAAG